MGKDFHLPDEVITLPLKEGEVYKNYKELCKVLKEKERTGGARQNQHRHWALYFDYEKEGYKYIIKKVLNNVYPRWDTVTGRQRMVVKNHCPLQHRRYYDENFQFEEWERYYNSIKGYGFKQVGVYFAYLCLGYYAGVQLRNLEKLNDLVETLWFDGKLSKAIYLKYAKHYEKFIDHVEIGYNTSLDIASHKRSRTMQSNPKKPKYTLRKRHKITREHLREKQNIKSGLYRFINEHEEVIYIGQSINLKSRIITHMFGEQGKLTKQTLEEIDRIEALIINPYLKTLIEILEIYYINKHQPKLNISRKYPSKEFVSIQDFDSLEDEWVAFWKPQK